MSLSSAPALPTKRLPSLLVALNARERRLFLEPAGEIERLKTQIRCTWPADGQLSNGVWEAFLRDTQPTVILTCWGTPALPVRWLQSPDCSLRYVCHVTGSVRQVVPRLFLENGGLVTNWGGIAGPAAAEHALLLALAALRNLNAWRPFMALPAAERNSERIGTRSLFGRSVGLHGFGSIARALASLLRPFGVKLHAFSSGVSSATLREEGVQPCGSLTELFRSSEILFECEALTAATTGSVSAAVLAALPDGAIFVNVGRGRVVDEAALVREAASGRIRLALDVAHETITPDSEVYRLDDAVLSPHIAGPSHDQYRRCGELALQNVERFLHGRPLEAQVTLDIYDRST